MFPSQQTTTGGMTVPSVFLTIFTLDLIVENVGLVATWQKREVII